MAISDLGKILLPYFLAGPRHYGLQHIPGYKHTFLLMNIQYRLHTVCKNTLLNVLYSLIVLNVYLELLAFTGVGVRNLILDMGRATWVRWHITCCAPGSTPLTRHQSYTTVQHCGTKTELQRERGRDGGRERGRQRASERICERAHLPQTSVRPSVYSALRTCAACSGSSTSIGGCGRDGTATPSLGLL